MMLISVIIVYMFVCVTWEINLQKNPEGLLLCVSHADFHQFAVATWGGFRSCSETHAPGTESGKHGNLKPIARQNLPDLKYNGHLIVSRFEFLYIPCPGTLKMRPWLKMVKEMQIEILNGGEIIVNQSKSRRSKFLGISPIVNLNSRKNF